MPEQWWGKWLAEHGYVVLTLAGGEIWSTTAVTRTTGRVGAILIAHGKFTNCLVCPTG